MARHPCAHRSCQRGRLQVRRQALPCSEKGNAWRGGSKACACLSEQAVQQRQARWHLSCAHRYSLKLLVPQTVSLARTSTANADDCLGSAFGACGNQHIEVHQVTRASKKIEERTRDSMWHGGHPLECLQIQWKPHLLHARPRLLRTCLRRQLPGSYLLQLRDERGRHLLRRKLCRLRARRGGRHRPHGGSARGALGLGGGRPLLQGARQLLRPGVAHRWSLQRAAGVSHGNRWGPRVAAIHPRRAFVYLLYEWVPPGPDTTRGPQLLRLLHAGWLLRLRRHHRSRRCRGRELQRGQSLLLWRLLLLRRLRRLGQLQELRQRCIAGLRTQRAHMIIQRESIAISLKMTLLQSWILAGHACGQPNAESLRRAL